MKILKVYKFRLRESFSLRKIEAISIVNVKACCIGVDVGA
jgi:hypothetical protein